VVVGGKGKSAMMVGQELLEVARRLPVDPGGLERISKLTAKVDSTLLQDGHQIYIHSLLLTSSGKWAVIQQGMNPRTRFARRYHWLNAVNFDNNPHEAVAGVKGDAVNVIDERTERTRGLILDLLREGPNRVLNLYSEARRKLGGPIDFWLWGRAVGAVEKSKKVIYYQPVDLKRVRKVLEGRASRTLSLEDALFGWSRTLHREGPISDRGPDLQRTSLHPRPCYSPIRSLQLRLRNRGEGRSPLSGEQKDR